MLQHKNMAYIYNPQNQNYEELLENFVIRKKEFNKIVRELKNSDLNSSAQHYLIEGQRGTGKTSLLLRLRYEIEHNEELSKTLIAVQFAEEQYNIFDLCRLWESTAELLEEVEGFESLSDELDAISEDDSYSIDCFNIFEKALIKNNKRLVLLLDNFGDILDKLSPIEQMRLRDIFHSSNHIQLISSSSRALEHTYKHDKPFFEFFKMIKLDGLNKEEANILLKQLSKTANVDIENIIKNQPNRIETIRRLTGGIPRTIVLLFEIFLDNSANVFEDLEMILDRVTPLYKHRMDDLSTQQQAIMDTISLNWDGITAKEIVDGLSKRGFDTKKVSAQLKILEKNDLVLSRPMDKKSKIYMVKERFFNIWYLMRYGRKKNRTQVLWLVKFLQEWCDGDELINRAKCHIKCAQDGTLHPKGGYYMAEALASVITHKEIQHKLLSETKKALIKFDSKINKKMSKSDLEISKETDIAYKDKNFELAIKNSKYLIERGYEISMFNLAFLYKSEFEDYVQAIKYYKMAVDKKYIPAMFNLANLYLEELKEYDKAIKYYKLILDFEEDVETLFSLGIVFDLYKENKDESIKYYKMAIKKGHGKAMFNLASLFEKDLKEYNLAIKYYKMAINKNIETAIESLAMLYQNYLNDNINAIKYYKIAIEKGNEYLLNNLAVSYHELNDYENALKYYKMAINKGQKESIFNLALLYEYKLSDYENAIKYYKLSLENNDVMAMVNLSVIYKNKFNDVENAIKYLKMAVDEKHTQSILNLASYYGYELKDYASAIKYFNFALDENDYNALHELGSFHNDELKDYKSAIKYYKMAIEKDNLKSMNSLSWLYFELDKEKSESLSLIQKAINIEKNKYNIHTFAIVQLWNDLYYESITTIEEFIESFDYQNFLDDMTDYFLLLLAKKQYHLAYNLFEKYPDLKDKLKPIYYALMKLLKDEYPKEYLKMGTELEETVDEILKEVEEKAKKYN